MAVMCILCLGARCVPAACAVNSAPPFLWSWATAALPVREEDGCDEAPVPSCSVPHCVSERTLFTYSFTMLASAVSCSNCALFCLWHSTSSFLLRQFQNKIALLLAEPEHRWAAPPCQCAADQACTARTACISFWGHASRPRSQRCSLCDGHRLGAALPTMTCRSLLDKWTHSKAARRSLVAAGLISAALAAHSSAMGSSTGSSPLLTMTTFLEGLPEPEPTASTLYTTSMPSSTAGIGGGL